MRLKLVETFGIERGTAARSDVRGRRTLPCDWDLIVDRRLRIPQAIDLDRDDGGSKRFPHAARDCETRAANPIQAVVKDNEAITSLLFRLFDGQLFRSDGLRVHGLGPFSRTWVKQVTSVKSQPDMDLAAAPS